MRITATNYEAQKNTIDWAKVPKNIKNFKEDMEYSLRFYDKNKDIKETIDLWLSHINKYVKAPANKTTPKPKYKVGDLLFTKNMNKLGEEFLVESVEIEKGKVFYKGKYNRGRGGEYVLVESTFTGKSNGSKPKQEKSKSTAKKQPKTTKKTVSHKVNKQNVDHFSNEYMLLRRFYNLINTKKPINFRKLQLLFMAFEKAAVEKKVRKTSKVAGLYNQANAKLVKMYEVAKPNQEDIKVNINDKAFYNRLEKFVTGYQTDPAIRLLKRFINMQGTKPEKASAKRLLTAITNAIDKGKVSDKHRLYKELQEAKKELTSYLASPTKLKPHAQALNKPNQTKKKNEVEIKPDNALMSLTQLSDTNDNETFKIYGDIGKFLGNIERKPVASIAVTTDAPQGAGKTTFAFQKIDAFARAGNKVLFVSLEEHPESNIFKRKVKQYISPQASKNVFVLGELENGIETLKKYIPQFDAIFIDSWQKVVKEAREKNGKRIDFDYDFRKAFNGKYFDVIFQRTQAGKMRGGSEAQFDGDVILKIAKGDSFKENYVFYDKNRYMIDNYIWNIAEQKLIKVE